MESDVRTVGIPGGWKRTARDGVGWEHSVQEGRQRFMAEWKRTEEDAAKTRQEKRREESNDKDFVVSGVQVGNLKRLRAELIGPTRVLLKRCRLCLDVVMGWRRHKARGGKT